MSEKTRSTALTVYDEMSKPGFLIELGKAIPNTLKPERMLRLALTVLRKNEALAKCSKESIMACVVESAQLGLEPDSVLGLVHIVPFGGEATLIVGYRGFAQLMYRSGQIVGLSAEIVREGDRFSRVLGTERRLVHVPRPVPMKGDKPDDPESKWLGAYAAAKFLSGTAEFEYMEASLIFSIRSRSRSWQKYQRDGKSSPWAEYPDKIEMWRKTPLRRLAKRMPISMTDERAPLLRAVMLDEYGEKKGLLIPTLGGFQVNPDPPDEEDDEKPIARTQEVIDVSPQTAANPEGAGERQKAVSGGRRTPSGGSPSKSKAAPPASNPAVPKANLQGLPAKPPIAEDPFIDPKEQTKVFDTGFGMGWKIDEIRAWLKKSGFESVAKIRRSQFAKVLQVMKSGT